MAESVRSYETINFLPSVIYRLKEIYPIFLSIFSTAFQPIQVLPNGERKCPLSVPRARPSQGLNCRHDVKFGVDYQDVATKNDATAFPRVIGFGYNPDAPAGFQAPLLFRRYHGPEGTTVTEGTRQDGRNELGEVTIDSTDVAPRLAAGWDVRGDSTLLLHHCERGNVGG